MARGLTSCETFGRECSGVVKRCGSNVTGFHPGDRVLAIGEDTFRTQYLAPAVCCRKLADWIPYEVISKLNFAPHGILTYTHTTSMEHLSPLPSLLHGMHLSKFRAFQAIKWVLPHTRRISIFRANSKISFSAF